ncbi:hypothetical protein [Actinacidiphila sp. ITFR-21]|uniref:hypothetical protein n=1 Tax=Actinacidiphila sp. ITFR-21 TaxID=3075199 RepID=UPI00288AE892|nr:hypothetical protein [Streptomyces sp. ITFR-21]WNI20124.1 hypothetical protein RLT57_31795 [Streptomyces sp. ITFR-21]
MFSLDSLFIGFALGVTVAFLAIRSRQRRRRVVLPPSVRTASPELVAMFTLVVAEQFPEGLHCAYATVSVWERNAPDTFAYLYPAPGPSLGCVRLDAAEGPVSAAAARMLAEMDLPAGVLMVPLVGR